MKVWTSLHTVSRHTTVDYLKDLNLKEKNNLSGLVSCLVLQRTFNPPSEKLGGFFLRSMKRLDLDVIKRR